MTISNIYITEVSWYRIVIHRRDREDIDVDFLEESANNDLRSAVTRAQRQRRDSILHEQHPQPIVGVTNRIAGVRGELGPPIENIPVAIGEYRAVARHQPDGGVRDLRGEGPVFEMIDADVGIDPGAPAGLPEPQRYIRFFIVAGRETRVETAGSAKFGGRYAEEAAGDVIDVARVGVGVSGRRFVAEMPMRDAVAPNARAEILDRSVELQNRRPETCDFILVALNGGVQTNEYVGVEFDIVIQEDEIFAVRQRGAEIARAGKPKIL